MKRETLMEIDPKIMDAIILYREILKATKEAFGEEKMTEEVIVNAITAGSFSVWRGIMGGKNDSCSTSIYRSERDINTKKRL
ncbi:MAG: hypothetical protein IIY19_07910 [Lachnospiraceae bacterium]|nr:hypothetical protein [Lachnospiraceae bacterium]